MPHSPPGGKRQNLKAKGWAAQWLGGWEHTLFLQRSHVWLLAPTSDGSRPCDPALAVTTGLHTHIHTADIQTHLNKS